MKNNENIGHKIVDAAPVMDYIRTKLLIDGDNPALEDVLERLRNLPTYTAHWQWNKETKYWECSDCKMMCAPLLGQDENCNPYSYQNTKFCGRCGAEMRRI